MKTLICPICEKEVDLEITRRTRDCHGIPYRLVCVDCYDYAMERGYDGADYSSADENIWGDY